MDLMVLLAVDGLTNGFGSTLGDSLDGLMGLFC
jgi:hypothetical protein